MASLNRYFFFIEDTMNHRKGMIVTYNEASDSREYRLVIEFGQITEYTGMVVYEDYRTIPLTDFLEDGHTYQWYLVYCPNDTVLNDITSNDMLEWIINSRVVQDGEFIERELVKLKDVISESGLWTYNREQSIEDNKYTVLDTGTSPFTTL